MPVYQGKYADKTKRNGLIKCLYLLSAAASFSMIEVYSSYYLGASDNPWPVSFGILWSILLAAVIYLMPGVLSRILYGITYLLTWAYAVAQTGYYVLFREMMWLSEFRYASEGRDYADILLNFPIGWFVGAAVLLVLGIGLILLYQQSQKRWWKRVLALTTAVLAAAIIMELPDRVFEADDDIRYASTDYGRVQSAEAAYDNMFSPYRLYQVCGLYHMLFRDLYIHNFYPLTSEYRSTYEANWQAVSAYLAEQPKTQDNDLTGCLSGQNVILVLMESMDDWMLGEHTPNLNRLINEGVSFTNFYTPAYGGIRTFNTEFCINTGSFLSSAGGYAFDYVTNHFEQSLPNLLRRDGYSALAFHYNTPNFYSRGVFSKAMGYEAYVSYMDYETDKQRLYDDQLLFDDQQLSDLFFRDGKRLNFVITRSAHLSYKYNEVLSNWGLKKYPEYRGMTGNQETDCAYLKARLVDDFFGRLLQELEERGELSNTVIIGVTDHYTYGYKDTKTLLELSGVSDQLLLEKTPCFIWSSRLEPKKVDKILNTSDLMPTMLNLLGIESPYTYIGRDAFDEAYDGYVPFSGGSWIWNGSAFNADQKKLLVLNDGSTVSTQEQALLNDRVRLFVRINNLILETDYYKNVYTDYNS